MTGRRHIPLLPTLFLGGIVVKEESLQFSHKIKVARGGFYELYSRFHYGRDSRVNIIRNSICPLLKRLLYTMPSGCQNFRYDRLESRPS